MKVGRRDVLKGGMAAPAVAAVSMVPAQAQSGLAQSASAQGAPRERLLLDFGWRFHFGHANDATKDFGFGAGRSGGFQKTGGFLSTSNLAYDDSDWKPVDLPHDWAIGLPFKNDPALASKGSYPLGRDYPRRVFDVAASDAGRRISVEFDGAYRKTIVVFYGYYIGRHSGGAPPAAEPGPRPAIGPPPAGSDPSFGAGGGGRGGPQTPVPIILRRARR